MKEVNGIVITDKIMKHVWDKLDAMKDGDRLELSAVAPKSPELFIECTKYHIDCFSRHHFSDDYSQIIKAPTIKLK